MGGDPAGKGLHGCCPSVPLQALVSEGAFAMWVQVYPVQTDPQATEEQTLLARLF